MKFNRSSSLLVSVLASAVATVVDASSSWKCHYDGESVWVGDWLTGDTHTCLCTWHGWRHCIDNDDTIPVIASEAGIFETLLAAVTAAGLAETLSGAGPFTVLAPTDDAFGDLPDGLVSCLLEPGNKGDLVELLTYHVIGGAEVFAGDLEDGLTVEMLNGGEVTVDVTKTGPWWHQTTTIRFNDSKVVKADVKASNGVVHAIDAVLVPDGFNPDCGDGGDDEPQNNAIEAAEGAGIFNTLLAAVEAADLTETLSGSGTFTVLAPEDDAFAKLDGGLVDCLLRPQNKAVLTDLLLYHVVGNAAVLSTDLSDGSSVKMLNDQDVGVEVRNSGAVFFNENAKVILADIEVSNGVVHAIDTVLVPPVGFSPVCDESADDLPSIVDVAAGSDDFSTLVAALTAADLVATLQGDGPFTVFAPNDDAFGKLPGGLVDCLLKPENKGMLQDLLTYHVASGETFSTDLSDGQEIPMLNGDEVAVDITRFGTIRINKSKVVVANNDASNGVVHIVGSVLVPPKFDVSCGGEVCADAYHSFSVAGRGKRKFSCGKIRKMKKKRKVVCDAAVKGTNGFTRGSDLCPVACGACE